MIIKATHGSPINLIKAGGAKICDYTISNYSSSNDQIIKDLNGNILDYVGLDSHGPGFYTWNVATTSERESIKAAEPYAKGGFIHKLHIDLDNDQLMNNRYADEIEATDLTIMIKSVIEKIWDIHQFKPNEFYEAINEIVEAFEDGDLDEMNLLIEQAKNNFEYDFEGYSPHEAIDDTGDLYDWTYEVIDDFMNTANPCAYIYDLSVGVDINNPLIKQMQQVTGELSERGVYDIHESRVESELITTAAYAAVSALNRSETMWDLICNTYNSVAFDPRGANDQYCYNNTFLTTLTSELSEYNLVAAETGRDRDILVIVDFDAIKFDKVIDLTKRLNKESSLELN